MKMYLHRAFSSSTRYNPIYIYIYRYLCVGVFACRNYFNLSFFAYERGNECTHDARPSCVDPQRRGARTQVPAQHLTTAHRHRPATRRRRPKKRKSRFTLRPRPLLQCRTKRTGRLSKPSSRSHSHEHRGVARRSMGAARSVLSASSDLSLDAHARGERARRLARGVKGRVEI